MLNKIYRIILKLMLGLNNLIETIYNSDDENGSITFIDDDNLRWYFNKLPKMFKPTGKMFYDNRHNKFMMDTHQGEKLSFLPSDGKRHYFMKTDEYGWTKAEQKANRKNKHFVKYSFKH